MMEAACRGASAERGITVGILPGTSASDANAHVLVPIPTGIGYARNVVNVLSGDAVIALEGSNGTLSEIACALGYDIPVVALCSWTEVDGVVEASDPEDAVDRAFALARGPHEDSSS